MSRKYALLGAFLRRQSRDEIPMSFDEIERIIGSALPPNSQHYPAWWSNSPWNNVMTKVWLDAGFKSEKVNIKERKLVFRRVETKPSKQIGLGEEAREYESAKPAEKKEGRHPLLGSMKGTFWIDPAWDLTKPTMDEDELAQMDANLERTADLIEAGMSRKRK
jgi:hypothetical protein